MEEDKDVYEDEFLEEAMEADEINDLEEGFMKGYDDEEELVKCAKCKRLVTEANAIEKEINNETYVFCSQQCAKTFKKKK